MTTRLMQKMIVDLRKSEKPEEYFQSFRPHIVGVDHRFQSAYGTQKMLYADWIASGRFYQPIEERLQTVFGPMIANPHSFSSETGKASTYAYRQARQIIKDHVNAHPEDVLITSGTGMTGVLSRLQRIMGLRFPGARQREETIAENDRPVVFITHMEHHSNQVPWLETTADVVMVPCDEQKLVCPQRLENELEKYRDRKLKIGAFTACSNVTGIITPYQQLAKIMHRHGGYCFVDFAASAPYITINMHPADEEERLDAILFSPHKFLGGPGSCGVLVFNQELYSADCPDVPGGGNVKWTTPQGTFQYHDDIETKEDGGTPGFLQVIRTALAINLKEKMNPDCIAQREAELLTLCYRELAKVAGLYILGDTNVPRIGCVSFGIEGIHYNLIVRLLNDRFGIQVRGGWSCASTYSHILMDISTAQSNQVIQEIENADLTNKPGWVRLSLHPTTTDKELLFICQAIHQVAENIEEWQEEYQYNQKTNEFEHIRYSDDLLQRHVHTWFNV